jgi:hypothetical protein
MSNKPHHSSPVDLIIRQKEPVNLEVKIKRSARTRRCPPTRLCA